MPSPKIFSERRTQIGSDDCLYEILEVVRGADPHEVKRAYARLLRKWHYSRVDAARYDECVYRVGVYVQAYRLLRARPLFETCIDRLKHRCPRDAYGALLRRVLREAADWE